jgi:tetratricopeptide (TPR) repeat protein
MALAATGGLAVLSCKSGAEAARSEVAARREGWYRALVQDDATERLYAVEGLLAYPDEAADRLVILASGQAPAAARAWAVYLLARHREEFDPRPFLEDEHAEVRYRAAEGAGLRGSASGVRVMGMLGERLGDEQPVVRIAAAWAILKVAVHPRAPQVLVSALDVDSPAPVSREAARRLSALYGALVAYDPSRGLVHRALAARDWARRLNADPRLEGVEVQLPSRTPSRDAAVEINTLRSLARAIEVAEPTRTHLVEVWGRAMAWKGGEPEVFAARRDLLNLLLDALRSEGLLQGDLGRTLLQLGEEEAALEHYAVATRLHPELTGLFEEYGTCLEAAGRTREAVSAFEKCAGLAPGEAGPLCGLGRVLDNLGRWAEAARVLTAAEVCDESRWIEHRILLGRMLDAARSRGETLSESTLPRE